MQKFTIHFRNRLEISVIAEKLEITRSKIDGKLYSYSFSGIKGTIPFYMDTEEILAITQEEVEL